MTIMWKRIREIVKKEFLQTLREPRMRLVLFLPPMVQLVIFGYAVNLDVEVSRIAWMDQDSSAPSRDFRAAFEGSGRFRVRVIPAGEKEIQQLLDNSDVDAVIRILPGFGRDIQRGATAVVQILVDGANSNTASIVSGYISQLVAEFSRRLSSASPPVEARTRVWFNPDLRSRNYFVPGVVVNIIALVTLMLTAMAIVREKEIGTMEQLMVTPIRPLELMLGKTLPFALVGLLDVALVTGAALLVFRIPFRGSIVLLFGCATVFLLTTLGVGLFISTIARTQQQAMMAAFFFVMPAFLLSGFTFPIRNMPTAVQYLTYLDPIRYFMEIVRGIFLKGAGLAILWPQVLSLLVLGIAVLTSSSLRFRKRLD